MVLAGVRCNEDWAQVDVPGEAAQANKLLPFCLQLCEELRDQGEFGEHRYQSMCLLNELCVLGRKRALTADDLSQWRLKSAFHMYHYCACGFRVYPKHHYFLHFPMIVERSGVPRSFWVYSAESKNAQTKRLYNVCSKGHGLEQQILLRLEWLRALIDQGIGVA